MKRHGIAISTACILLVILTGCATSDPSASTGAAPSSGAAADTAPAVTQDPSVALSGCPAATEEYGDVIPGGLVTDAFGTYCHTVISPEARALVYDATKTDVASLKEFGLTEENAAQAQKAAVTVLANILLDSSRLDDATVPGNEWFAANSAWIAPEAIPVLQKSLDQYGATSLDGGFIATHIFPSTLRRSEIPRSSGITLLVNAVRGEKSSDGTAPLLIVEAASTSLYDLADADLVSLYMKSDPAKTESSLRESNPELFDGKDFTGEAMTILTGSSVVGMRIGDMNRPIGTDSSFQLATVNGEVLIAYS